MFISFLFVSNFIVLCLSIEICRSPKNESGVCIIITRCDKLQNILEKMNSGIDRNSYLKNSMCGFESNTVKVCCPLAKLQPVSGNSNINTSLLPRSNECGRTSQIIRNRIIGGNSALLGQYFAQIISSD